MKVLQAIVIGALVVLAVQKLSTVGNQKLQNNKMLVCLLKDLKQETSLIDSECVLDEKGITKNFSSFSIESLEQRRLLFNNPQELASQEGIDLCHIQLPQPWNDPSLRDDPRAQQITYYKVLANRQYGMKVSGFDQCAQFLPSSTYLHLISKGYTWLADDRFSPLTKEIAYQADRGWTRPYWRALNALEQGDDYLKSGNFDLATIAFLRSLESLSQEDFNNKDYYSSLAYRGLAETAEKNGNLQESIEYYQLAIKASTQLSSELTPAYVKVLIEDDRNEATSRLISFITNNDLDTPEYIFNVTLALVELSELDSADKLLEFFKLPDSPYWLAANGAVSRSKGQFATASSFFRNAVELSSNIDPSMVANWAARLAVTYILQGDLVNGIEAQKLVTSLRPDSPYYWHDLALFYQLNNQFDLALEAINKALELAPENDEFLNLRNQIVNHEVNLPL